MLSDEIVFIERQILSVGLIERKLYQLYTNLSEKVEDLANKLNILPELILKCDGDPIA